MSQKFVTSNGSASRTSNLQCYTFLTPKCIYMRKHLSYTQLLMNSCEASAYETNFVALISLYCVRFLHRIRSLHPRRVEVAARTPVDRIKALETRQIVDQTLPRTELRPSMQLLNGQMRLSNSSKCNKDNPHEVPLQDPANNSNKRDSSNIRARCLAVDDNKSVL